LWEDDSAWRLMTPLVMAALLRYCTPTTLHQSRKETATENKRMGKLS
jgi:hypothetical protein